MKHFIEVSDFSKEELISLIEVGQDIMQNPAKYGDAMKGRLLATLFYEPSTRTRFSFEAAMLRLGGQVIGFSEAQNSSVAKGESVKDTIRTVACYADIAVMRHYLEGAPKLASVYSDIPVVNAGDGGHQHPTQTITDLLTIQMEKGRLTNLNVVLCGDLKNGRTVHSLVKALSKFENNTFYFVSPKELKIPDYIKNHIKDSLFFEMESLEDALPMADVLYMTRIQRERFADPEQYEKLKGILGDKDTLELSYEDDLRCQDALSLLKSRNYILDASTLCEKRYIKAAEWDGFGDWLNEMIKESNRMSRREWTIAIVSAAIGAAIGLIPTIIGALC